MQQALTLVEPEILAELNDLKEGQFASPSLLQRLQVLQTAYYNYGVCLQSLERDALAIF